MTTNTIHHDTPALNLTQLAIGTLGPDLFAEFIAEGGQLEEPASHSDAVQLAAGHLHAKMIADGALTGRPKAHHLVTLGYFRATAAELFARRNGDPDHDLCVECTECGKTTWIDTTQGIPVGMYSILRGANPDDLDYEDRCGWCGAEVTA